MVSNWLVTLSRLDQNRITVKLAPLDLNTVVAEYATDRSLLAKNKQLKLTFEPAPGLPTCKGDRQLLGEVLSVFLTNALNYTPSGGAIWVRTQTRQIKKRKWVGFSVSDTGPGINPEEMGKLFTRFFRGTTGVNSGVAGTGLGLAIAREIVERHHGEIDVQSEDLPGKGVIFTVWLPVGGE